MKNFLKHVFVWAVFILYEMSFIALSGARVVNFWDYFIHYGINITLFYANAGGFAWIFASRYNRAGGIALLLLLELGLYLCLQNVIYLWFHSMYITGGWKDFASGTQIAVHIYRALYFIGFSIGYWFARSAYEHWKKVLELENLRLRENVQRAELEHQLMQARNAYLQAQLNPHLLFNTLNFIYNAVRKLSDTAATAVLLLSDMMRYSLSETGVNGTVPLQQEIEHIKSLVQLNQLRYQEKLCLTLVTEGSFKQETIIPLLLISFIENIYKHGDLHDDQQPASIYITCLDGRFLLRCTNKKNNVPAFESWGIGVANVKARLQSYYPGNYQLNIDESELLYTVQLAVSLR
jgi:two-component system LytT family sensor kinase